MIALLGTAYPAVAQEAPVAARELPRGTQIEAADVAGEGADKVVGWITRRLVEEGDPLVAPAVAAPDIIRSGDPVQLIWREGTLELRLSGKAMGSAAEGESLLVRVDRKRRYKGIASAPGEVHLSEIETR